MMMMLKMREYIKYISTKMIFKFWAMRQELNFEARIGVNEARISFLQDFQLVSAKVIAGQFGDNLQTTPVTQFVGCAAPDNNAALVCNIQLNLPDKKLPLKFLCMIQVFKCSEIIPRQFGDDFKTTTQFVGCAAPDNNVALVCNIQLTIKHRKSAKLP